MKAYWNRRYAVELLLPVPQTQRTMVGQFISGTIGKGLRNTGTPTLPIRTFRVRYGNGAAGTKPYELIQDQYNYFVPWPNCENIPQAEKDDFAAGVAAWKELATPVKKNYDAEATRKNLHMSGFNLYIRKWRLDLI